MGIRRLRTARGRTIRPTAAFRRLRDGRRPAGAALRARRPSLVRTLRALRRAGVARRHLQLAWSFTVASRRSTTGPRLHIRDDAFAQLGDTTLGDPEGRRPRSGLHDHAGPGHRARRAGHRPRGGGHGDRALLPHRRRLRGRRRLLNMLYLGRAMVSADGLRTHPALAGAFDQTQRLFYDGNSQGGIEGGALTAVAPDFDRAVLGVPGMNYSTLLQRSVDFAPFRAVLDASYPSALDRALIYSLLTSLWDRGEANGYAQHMTSDPLPDTPPHEVLLHVALGAHQVAPVTAEVEARTMGARVWPRLDPGRSADERPF